MYHDIGTKVTITAMDLPLMHHDIGTTVTIKATDLPLNEFRK